MKFFLTHLVLLICTCLFGQQSKISVSKSPALVGEPFEITVSILIPANSQVQISDKWDTLPIYFKNNTGSNTLADDKFEISSWSNSTKKQGDSIQWIGLAKAVIWDSGVFVFPTINYTVDKKVFKTDSLLIECQLEKKIQGKDLYEIRETFIDIAEAEKNIKEESKKLFYGIVILIVIVVFLIIFFLVRRVRKRSQLLNSTEMSLADRAILAINELEKLQLWKSDRHKDHFVELSFILRSFLSAYFELSLLEKTTAETLILLKQKNLSIALINSVEFVLMHADMVKFAQALMVENYILDLDNQARNCIQQTEVK
jgi:hypothetical protein